MLAQPAFGSGVSQIERNRKALVISEHYVRKKKADVLSVSGLLVSRYQ